MYGKSCIINHTFRLCLHKERVEVSGEIVGLRFYLVFFFLTHLEYVTALIFPSDISYFWDEYDSAVAPSHAGGFRAIEAMCCEILSI